MLRRNRDGDWSGVAQTHPMRVFIVVKRTSGPVAQWCYSHPVTEWPSDSLLHHWPQSASTVDFQIATQMICLPIDDTYLSRLATCVNPSRNIPYWFAATASNMTHTYNEWWCGCANPRPVTVTHILMKMNCLRADLIINENLCDDRSTLFSVCSRPY